MPMNVTAKILVWELSGLVVYFTISMLVLTELDQMGVRSFVILGLGFGGVVLFCLVSGIVLASWIIRRGSRAAYEQPRFATTLRLALEIVACLFVMASAFLFGLWVLMWLSAESSVGDQDHVFPSLLICVALFVTSVYWLDTIVHKNFARDLKKAGD